MPVLIAGATFLGAYRLGTVLGRSDLANLPLSNGAVLDAVLETAELRRGAR